MINETPFDTITAIATPPGEGGIGIVRISGQKSFTIIQKIFIPYNKQLFRTRPHSFHLYLGHIADGNRTIDEVLVSFMQAPHTYTREDVVEINCHGGAVAVNEVLRLVLIHGARLAEPGEFTRRAFIHGRIDLTQAEAVLDIVRAKTGRSLETAVTQLTGRLSATMREITSSLKEILILLEANIDFSEEEDIAPINYSSIKKRLGAIKENVNTLVKSYDRGKIYRDGVLTVLAGKPNVGKSSIMNAFLKFDRTIVTPIPGTTRDVIEEQLNLNGIPFILADTAGITASDNIIEQEGVKRSTRYLSRAQLVLLVFDGSVPLDDRDSMIVKQVQSIPCIPVINKTDLPQKIDESVLKDKTGIHGECISLSAKNGSGLERLQEKMGKTIREGAGGSDYGIMVTNSRHFAVLQKVIYEIEHALQAAGEKLDVEFLAFDVRNALDRLGEITGRVTNREILDDIFNNFCIGK